MLWCRGRIIGIDGHADAAMVREVEEEKPRFTPLCKICKVTMAADAALMAEGGGKMGLGIRGARKETKEEGNHMRLGTTHMWASIHTCRYIRFHYR